MPNRLHDLSTGILSNFSKDVEIMCLTKLHSLLYTEGTNIMPDSESDLQAALTAASDYCSVWNITVNP